MKVTMLDMSGKPNFEKGDIIDGDLVVVFSFESKEAAGLAGRKLAKLMYKEIELEDTAAGVLIKESEE